ncbi:hypothetical protein BKA67DRAFT_541164 [Truncatella angustata]|uniref:Uncharacterized protein n=1 Tax=Truncatella angustata TaxID=152316 RepID=A0A9P8RKX2_9PEZI|nr:uncharacterized protein BKA67DRAFT_541164 [Truncatella angustata]KAH6646183.1 hypothetical protein BKA67DRAFT_541164 [Truncatella angustata]
MASSLNLSQAMPASELRHKKRRQLRQDCWNENGLRHQTGETGDRTADCAFVELYWPRLELRLQQSDVGVADVANGNRRNWYRWFEVEPQVWSAKLVHTNRRSRVEPTKCKDVAEACQITPKAEVGLRRGLGRRKGFEGRDAPMARYLDAMEGSSWAGSLLEELFGVRCDRDLRAMTDGR